MSIEWLFTSGTSCLLRTLFCAISLLNERVGILSTLWHYFQCYGPPFDQRMTKKCFRILQRIFIHHSNLLRISSRCRFWHGQSIRKLAPTIKMYGGFWYGNEVVGISQIDKFSHVTWYWMFVVVQWFNPKTKRNATLNFTSPNWNFI